MYLQLPPPSGEGPIGGAAGPAGPPSLSYAYHTYLPYLLATTVLPLLGMIYITIRVVMYALKREIVSRPENIAYVIYLIGGFADLAIGAVVMYRLVNEYVYGTLPTWRWVYTMDDLITYKNIANFISYFYLIAGLTIGLSLLLILLFKTYEYWYVDFLIIIGNIGLFLYLTPRPLENFKFTSRFLSTHNVTVQLPYDLIKNSFLNNLYIGIILGGFISIITFIYYRYRTKIYSG